MHSFLWQKYFIVYMYHIFFIHSSIDGHLGCFPILAIVNSAAVDIGVHMSLSVFVFSGYMPSSMIAGSYVVLIRWENWTELWATLSIFSCIYSVQFSSVAQSFLTLCDPMNCSKPGLPVHHKLPEFTQTHVHRIGDAIQLSHPLSSPSPPAPNPSQHQGLFQWVSSSREVAKVLEFQLQHQSFQWTPRTDLL